MKNTKDEIAGIEIIGNNAEGDKIVDAFDVAVVSIEFFEKTVDTFNTTIHFKTDTFVLEFLLDFVFDAD